MFLGMKKRGFHHLNTTNGRKPDSLNPIERLCYMGERGMGALEFKPAMYKGRLSDVPIEIKDMVKLASAVLTNKEKLKEALTNLLVVGTSAGGARAKCIIAYNQDDHTKNIAFLMDRNGNWKLSPAYDIAYSYNPNGEWTSRHQMSLNGKRDKFTMEDLIEFGTKANLKKMQSTKIIKEIENVFLKWNSLRLPIKE